MEKLNCDLYELSELTESEKRDTEGGLMLSRAVLTLATAAVVTVVKVLGGTLLMGGAVLAGTLLIGGR